ncbi:transposase [Gordonia polyisoprenivorans]|nr:transposase [Gordonia polyisoprenivorans]
MTIADLPVAVALGGDCLADINQVRAHSGVFGHVASDSTVARLISTPAADATAALAAINTARVAAPATAWAAAGQAAPTTVVTPAHR